MQTSVRGGARARAEHASTLRGKQDSAAHLIADHDGLHGAGARGAPRVNGVHEDGADLVHVRAHGDGREVPMLAHHPAVRLDALGVAGCVLRTGRTASTPARWAMAGLRGQLHLLYDGDEDALGMERLGEDVEQSLRNPDPKLCVSASVDAKCAPFRSGSRETVRFGKGWWLCAAPPPGQLRCDAACCSCVARCAGGGTASSLVIVDGARRMRLRRRWIIGDLYPRAAVVDLHAARQREAFRGSRCRPAASAMRSRAPARTCAFSAYTSSL